MNPQRRFHFLLLSFLALAMPAALEAKIDRLRAVWIESPSTQTVIAWNQASGSDPVLRFGPRGADPANARSSVKPARREEYMKMDNRFVYLEGLQPDTAYAFTIADSEGTSPEYWFRTAPATPKPFTVIAGGDTKSEEEARARGRRGNRMVAKLRPLFVIYDGDFTSGTGLDADNWRNWLDDWARDTVSSDGRIFPIVPVRGNHEASPEILYRLFGLRDLDHYFAFNVGGDLLRVYALNSQIHVGRKNADGGGNSNATDCPAAKEQATWLAEDLAGPGAGATFRISAYHKPMRPHTRSKKDNDYLYDAWADAFHEHGMTIAIEGDSHMHKITYPLRPSRESGSADGFIRDDAGGTMFVGEGSWGAAVRDNNDDKPWTLHSARITQVKWMHVSPEEIATHTVLTENVDEIGANTEDNVFAVPSGLKLEKHPGFGISLKMPFARNGLEAGN